jgi:hypothetical protein
MLRAYRAHVLHKAKLAAQRLLWVVNVGLSVVRGIHSLAWPYKQLRICGTNT